MGEAKRRQQTNNFRPAGLPLSEFMMDMEKHIGRVPCGSCRACCYHPTVNIVEGEDHSKFDTEIRDDGERYLKRKPDGSCVHLAASGCTVYDHRPIACRNYDCRLFSAFRTQNTYQEGISQPHWLFRMDTRADYVIYTLGKLVRERLGTDINTSQLLQYVTMNFEMLLDDAEHQLDKMQNAPEHEQEKYRQDGYIF